MSKHDIDKLITVEAAYSKNSGKFIGVRIRALNAENEKPHLRQALIFGEDSSGRFSLPGFRFPQDGQFTPGLQDGVVYRTVALSEADDERAEFRECVRCALINDSPLDEDGVCERCRDSDG